jgi:magnesium chelatase family protein
MARRLPSILPDMTLTEAIETSKIHSIAGLLRRERSLIATRPFRAPHHPTSDAGLIGGGTIPGPGEVSLANRGMLCRYARRQRGGSLPLCVPHAPAR